MTEAEGGAPEPGAEEVVTETQEEVATETEEAEAAAPVEGAAPIEEAAPAVAPAAAPAYYPAVAPPPVTYSDPSPSWLGTAATFAGGAAVGGLVGWAIADDDDDDDDDGDRYSRGDIDIEDSTITVNRGGDELQDLQRQLEDERRDRQERRQEQVEETRENIQDQQRERQDRQAEQRAASKEKLQDERLKREAREQEQREQAKRQLQQRYPEKQRRVAAAGGGAKEKVSGLAASGTTQRTAATRESTGGRQLAATVDQAKAKADPGRRMAPTQRPAKSKTVRAGDRQQPQVATAFGGTKSAQQAKRESDRGLKSRSRATTEIKPNRSRGGGSAFAQRAGGNKAQASRGDRGRKNRRGQR